MTDSGLEDLMASSAQMNFEAGSGCCAFETAGVELVADPSGVVWWPDEQCLIVSDLHLEKGSSFARRGQLLPPYDTGETLSRLQKAMDRWQPEKLVALGDSFHDANASSRLPLAYRQQLSAMASSCDWVWITGNHDPEPPVDLAGLVSETLAIGPLHFCHEPRADGAAGEISGHLHPAARIKRQGRSIRRRCFALDNNRLILPSFGAYTGGMNVFDKAFDGLFDRHKFYAFMLGEDQVYKIAGKDLSR